MSNVQEFVERYIGNGLEHWQVEIIRELVQRQKAGRIIVHHTRRPGRASLLAMVAVLAHRYELEQETRESLEALLPPEFKPPPGIAGNNPRKTP